MTGVEWMLLLIGSIFMIGSFFVAEKLSPSELNKIAELSENELKNLIERELLRAKDKVLAMIDEQIEASIDQVDRALGKETNDKIMAISEYSDTVIEKMNKAHNEIMFLYSMLNDKHTELTGMVSELQRLAADIRNLEETFAAQKELGSRGPAREEIFETPLKEQSAFRQPQAPDEQPSYREEIPQTDEGETLGALSVRDGAKEVLRLHKEGMSEVEIARTLGMGIGEVRLMIGLYRGE